MDPLGLSKLPAEFQPVISGLMDRIDALEAQSAKDTQAVADKLIAALTPMVKEAVDSVNTLTVTVATSVDEALGLLRRGVVAKVEWGPEPGK